MLERKIPTWPEKLYVRDGQRFRRIGLDELDPTRRIMRPSPGVWLVTVSDGHEGYTKVGGVKDLPKVTQAITHIDDIAARLAQWRDHEMALLSPIEMAKRIVSIIEGREEAAL